LSTSTSTRAVAETAAEGSPPSSLADRWRLAVVDLFLREGNGFEVLRAGRARAAHQRMVVLTNFATPDIRRRVGDAGADAVFDKSTELDLFSSSAESTRQGSARSMARRASVIVPTMAGAASAKLDSLKRFVAARGASADGLASAHAWGNVVSRPSPGTAMTFDASTDLPPARGMPLAQADLRTTRR
jgi:DNA-binding NarL/FixJ family response regulator